MSLSISEKLKSGNCAATPPCSHDNPGANTWDVEPAGAEGSGGKLNDDRSIYALVITVPGKVLFRRCRPETFRRWRPCHRPRDGGYFW